MIKGEKIRLDIHSILYSIYKFNKNLDNQEIKEKIDKHNEIDISFLINVTLTSMRYHLHIEKIINKYVKKKLRVHEKILLLSAITQIVFLNFKDYAVINCSVEIAKKLKIYPGLINAVLKNISKDKVDLKNVKIIYNDLPEWFKVNTKSLNNNDKQNFLDTFNKQPDLHIIFKDKEKLNLFEKKIFKTSNISGFPLEKENLMKLRSFDKGYWWVQDFSSFFPIYNLPIVNKKIKILDACAAPGGKSFQLLSKKLNVNLNDISGVRIEKLKTNLKRLKFDAKIFNKDFTAFYEKEKYDFIIIDAPCTAVGTIRKNPEIFFKTKPPRLKDLVKIQKQMLNKASKLLSREGIILYMVCSFLKVETEDQINRFLEENNDFNLYYFETNKKIKEYSGFFKNNYMITQPSTIFKHNIDGYFAAYLKKENDINN
mgnify:CR=1 FL=1|tara:strand:+ start:1282 stop:2562 length:1281 start_codon:yes stop_codon:yes gene_type:complete